MNSRLAPDIKAILMEDIGEAIYQLMICFDARSVLDIVYQTEVQSWHSLHLLFLLRDRLRCWILDERMAIGTAHEAMLGSCQPLIPASMTGNWSAFSLLRPSWDYALLHFHVFIPPSFS